LAIRLFTAPSILTSTCRMRELPVGREGMCTGQPRCCCPVWA
jgi:hypothetical protein